MSPVRAPRRVSGSPSPYVRLRAGPFMGVDESQTIANITTNALGTKLRARRPDPRLAAYALDAFPLRPGFAQRPGWYLNTAPGGTGPVQWLGNYRSFSDPSPLAIRAGEIYAATSIGTTITGWTKRIAAADLSGAAITLSTTAVVYALLFQDELFVTDGINTPFLWDGTAGGGLTKLTNCPVLFGQPVEHYGKVFGILASDPRSAVWSEEADANLGYNTSPYTNIWDFRQTSHERLVALVGTNEQLIVIREKGITAVYGAVNSEFTSAGTLDAISTDVGMSTLDPHVTIGGRDVFFIDAQGIGRILNLDRGFRGPDAATFERTRRQDVDVGIFGPHMAAFHPSTELAFINSRRPTSGASRIMVLDARLGTYIGQWTIPGSHKFNVMAVFPIGTPRMDALVIGTQDGDVLSMELPPSTDATFADPSAAGIPFELAAVLGRERPGLKTVDLVNVRGNLPFLPDAAVFHTDQPAWPPSSVGGAISGGSTGPGQGTWSAGVGPIFAREIGVRIAFGDADNDSRATTEVLDLAALALLGADDLRVTT